MSELTIESLYNLKISHVAEINQTTETYTTPEGDVVEKIVNRYPSGQIHCVTYKKNGVYHDIFGPSFRSYTIDGKSYSIESHRNGALHRDAKLGPALVFEDGNHMECGYYFDGEFHRPRDDGWAYTVYENGQVTEKTAYETGKLVNRKGFAKKIYVNGEFCQGFVVDEKTQRIVEMQILCCVGGNGWWTTFKNPEGFNTNVDRHHRYVVEDEIREKPSITATAKEEKPIPELVVAKKTPEPTPSRKLQPAKAMRQVVNDIGIFRDDPVRKYTFGCVPTEELIFGLIFELSNKGITTFRYTTDTYVASTLVRFMDEGYKIKTESIGFKLWVITISW